MSTLTPSPAGRSPTLDAAVQDPVEQTHSHASLIPRSALVDGSRSRRADTLNDARLLLDSQGHSNVSIDIPLNKQSSLNLGVTHDVSPHVSSGPSSHLVDPPAIPASDTARQYQSEQSNHTPPTHTASQLGQSPRKHISAHGLPKGAAPILATAQRAKERTHKKGSATGSSSNTKTLRLTRSSADLGRSHGKEGATYLTKEALVAVESAVVSPASQQSPLKVAGSPSKPAWNSPVTPPGRGGAHQQPTYNPKMSPTKSMHLTAESILTGHSRASSSIATSTGKTSFHTADGSPVRSPTNTVDSFQSVAESLEVQEIPMFGLSADTGGEQLPRHLNTSPTSGIKNKGQKHVSLSKPILPLQSSTVRFGPDTGGRPLAPSSPDADAFGNNCSAGLVSAAYTSRIPRVSTLAKNTDRPQTSALQKAESVRFIQSKIKMLQDAHVELDEAALSIIITSNDSQLHATLDSEQVPMDSQNQELDHLSPKEEKPSPKVDPKGHGILESCENRNLEATMNNDAIETINDTKAGEDGALMRGRSECTSSDLRPTAVEFVPRSSPAITPTKPVEDPGNLASLQDVAGLPDIAMLDRYDIPFLWYMYSVQFAYEQGFRNRRPRSPRKYKPKMARGSVPSPGDAPHTASSQSPNATSVTAINPSLKAKQRISSAELKLPPRNPAQRLQPNYYHENQQSSFQHRRSSNDIDETADPAFAGQFDLIDQQAALSNCTNINTPRYYNVDPTRVSNAGFPVGPRSMHAPIFYTVPRNNHRANRHPGNGLFGGCGNAAGVPIDATTPFPAPTPPQGRQGHGITQAGSATDYSNVTIGKEACSIVDITTATELIGGGPCNACEPDH